MTGDYADISGSKVLIIADHQIHPDMLAGMLAKRDLQVSIAADGERGLKAAVAQKPDLILIDVINTIFDGYTICSSIKSSGETSSIPVILLASGRNPGDPARAFEAGADDYVASPFLQAELTARVETHLKMRRMERELLKQTRVDSLTGIWNQRYFRELCEVQIQQSVRGDNRFSVAVCEINQYRDIMEKYGQRAGDFIFRAFANELKKHIRAYDIPGRSRSEQFAAAFPSCDRTAAAAIMQRLKDLIEMSSFGFENTPLQISFSCGISDISEIDEKNILDELLRVAGERLSLSKENGWGKIVSDKRYFGG